VSGSGEYDSSNEGCRDTPDVGVHAIQPQHRPGSTYKSTQKRADMNKPHWECWSCGQTHDITNKEACPAYGKECKKCHKKHHFASRCWSKRPGSQRVRAVDIEEDVEVFPMEVATVELDNSQLVTLKLESGSYIQFQTDTGAQCNVIPLEIYKKVTRDFSLTHISPSQTAITAYGGKSMPVAGTVRLKVWRRNDQYKMDYKLVDSDRIRPLLGRKACAGMKIITYLDNDSMNCLDTKDAAVFALEVRQYTSKEHLIQQHPKVFEEKVGKLKGEYHIRLDDNAIPMQHCPIEGCLQH